MICTVRIPDVLQARIDAAAGEGKRSEWILEACRMRLDGGVAQHGNASGLSEVSGSSPDTPAKPQREPEIFPPGASPYTKGTIGRMADDELAVRKARVEQAMSDAYMGKALVHRFDDHVPKVVDVPICAKTWWEDGEQYECLMDKGHREALLGKHGLRGMVQRID